MLLLGPHGPCEMIRVGEGSKRDFLLLFLIERRAMVSRKRDVSSLLIERRARVREICRC